MKPNFIGWLESRDPLMPWEGRRNGFIGTRKPIKTSQGNTGDHTEVRMRTSATFKGEWCKIGQDLFMMAWLIVTKECCCKFCIYWWKVDDDSRWTKQNCEMNGKTWCHMKPTWDKKRDGQHITTFCKGVLDLLGTRWCPLTPRLRRMDGQQADAQWACSSSN